MSNSSVVPFGEPLWYSRGSSPYYNDSHKRLRDSVRAYIEDHIIPHCAEWEAAGHVPKEVCIHLWSEEFVFFTTHSYIIFYSIGTPRLFIPRIYSSRSESCCHCGIFGRSAASWQHQSSRLGCLS